MYINHLPLILPSLLLTVSSLTHAIALPSDRPKITTTIPWGQPIFTGTEQISGNSFITLGATPTAHGGSPDPAAWVMGQVNSLDSLLLSIESKVTATGSASMVEPPLITDSTPPPAAAPTLFTQTYSWTGIR